MTVPEWTTALRGAVLSLSIACIASCAAPRERTQPLSRAVADDPAHVSPANEATRFRVDTEIFEVPLALAEELYGRADEQAATIGTFPDEAHCRTALELLAPTNPAIAHTRRANTELEIGKLEWILPREPRSSSKEDVADVFSSEFASDYLTLNVRLTRSDGWPPLQLETQIRWTDPRGRLLARLPSATSPLPDGCWMEIACLPSRREAASEKTLALLVFLHVISLDPARRPASSPR